MTTESDSQQEQQHRQARNWLVKSLVGNAVLGVILFVSAGTLQWLMGWLFLSTTLLASIGTYLFVDDEVIVERSVNRRSTERWDNVILSLVGVNSMLLTPVIAGLTVRFGWPPQLAPVIELAAFAVTLAGWAFHIWAMVCNRYFAIVVRLQTDRGQTVVDSGPYRWIRHPGYLGGVIFSIATPLLLGSLWALIPGVLAAILLVIRTALEDRFLQSNLDGYRDYAKRVRYQLIPGVWQATQARSVRRLHLLHMC